jgi:Spy/CpxP family protein refolding chaperone
MRHTIPILLSLLMLAPLGLSAQQPPRARRPMMQQGMRQMQAPQRQMTQMAGWMGQEAVYNPAHLLQRRQALELTDDQVSRLEALAEETKQAHQQAQSEMQGRAEQLREAWGAEQTDPDAIRTRASSLMELQNNAHLVMLTSAAQAKALLTAEQRGRVTGWIQGRGMRGRETPGRGSRMQRTPRRTRRWP